MVPVPTLKMLNLSNAQLASIDESVNNIMNPKRLTLDGNYSVSLPNQIGKRCELYSHSKLKEMWVGSAHINVGSTHTQRDVDSTHPWCEFYLYSKRFELYSYLPGILAPPTCVT